MNTAEPLPLNIPYNSEAEASILGAIMRQNSLLDILHFLSDNHFYAQAHQRIFAACKKKISNGELATPITLAGQFANDPDLPNKEKYLIQCCLASDLNPLSVGQLGRYIRELSQRRDLIAACEKAKDSLMAQDRPIGEVAEEISAICEKIMAGDKKWEMQTGTQVTQAIIEDMKKDVRPYSTGIAKLDTAMDGGLYPGKLYGFAGKKKHGKTILGGTISVNLAVSGVKHLFICGEMSSQEVQQRNLARMGDFFPTAFRNGESYSKSEDFQQRFNKAMKWQQDNIIFMNAPDLTFDKLKHIVKQAVIRHGIKGFILDYWQLVAGKDGKKSMAEHLDEVAQWLASSSKQYGIFSIAMAQINQEGNTRGGEGLRLACDQLYQIQRKDISKAPMWLEMMDTRYTAWNNIGGEGIESLMLNGKGPYFEEFA